MDNILNVTTVLHIEGYLYTCFRSLNESSGGETQARIEGLDKAGDT